MGNVRKCLKIYYICDEEVCTLQPTPMFVISKRM